MKESNAFQKRILLAFWCIAILYILSIDLKGVWTDEGKRYMLMAGGQTWGQYNRSGSFGDFRRVINAVGTDSQYLPLFYLIDNAVIRLSESHSDLLLRLVNVLWLLLGMQGLLRFFRNYSESTRLFALAIFSLNGFMMMNVMQIREYPMYLTLLIWSSCLMFEVLELPSELPWRNTWHLLAGYGFLMGLFFNSQPYAVFSLAAQVLIASTWNTKRRLASLRRMALPYAIAAAVAAPWIIAVLLRFHSSINPGVWDRRAPTMGLLVEGFKGGFRTLFIYNAWSGHLLMQAFIVVIVAGIVTSWILATRAGEPQDRRARYAFWTCILFFVFQITFFFLNQPLSLWSRYFVSYYFGYVVLATCAFSSLRTYAQKQKQQRWALLSTAALAFVFCIGLEQVQLYRKDPFLDTGMTAACNWKVTSRAMLRYVRPDETVVYYHPLLAWTMSIYNPFYPNELSYAEADAGQFGGKAVLWVLDTGVVPEATSRTLKHLQASKYALTRTADLGCQCKLFRMEAGVTANPPPADTTETLNASVDPPANAVLIAAASVHSGTAIVDRTEFGAGLPIVRTYKDPPTWAEFWIRLPAPGWYEVRGRCASQTARPVTLSVDGRKLTESFCGLSTGGYYRQNQQWQSSGVYDFPKATISMRLDCAGPFPHISAIALVPVDRKR